MSPEAVLIARTDSLRQIRKHGVRRNDKLRICIDPQDLNEAICRPKYPIPSIDDILPKLAKAKIFSVLEAKNGFWQIKLDEPSSYLMCFWTTFGRL